MNTDKDSSKRQLNDRLLPQFKTAFDRRESGDEVDNFVESLGHTLIQEASRENISDIHIDPALGEHYVLRLRVDGALLDACQMEKPWADRLMNHFKVMAQLDPVPAQAPMEGWVRDAFEQQPLNFRISCAPSISGDKMSIRLFDPSRMRTDLRELGLSDDQSKQIRSWIDDIRGMFLVVGAIGSGKTTTLYALLNELLPRQRSIVTIEDPVEFPVSRLTQIQVSREPDLDFASALKSVARLDPDYVMVGELRDETSAQLALSAASFGKVLLGTLHSRDAAGAVSTLRNYGLKDFEIASALEMVVAQRLVRTLCPHCRIKKAVAEVERNWAHHLEWEIPDELWYPEGCDQCKGIGFNGRSGIFEVWHLDDTSKALLLDGGDEFTIRESITESSMRPLKHAAQKMVASGETSLEEIRTMGGLTS